MLLDLTKPAPVVQLPVKPMPPAPVLMQHGFPVEPKTPKTPSRFWCFFGIHKFEIKTETTWSTTDNGKVIAKGPMYILRCPVCGKMKAERLGSGA